MAEKVAKLKIKRDNAYMYFVNKGSVWRTPRVTRGSKRKGPAKRQKVASPGIAQDNRYLYFLDKQGDVSRAMRASARKRKSSKAKK
jgi:hypothetical protein